jgi:hypothetical protein
MYTSMLTGRIKVWAIPSEQAFFRESRITMVPVREKVTAVRNAILDSGKRINRRKGRPAKDVSLPVLKAPKYKKIVSNPVIETKVPNIFETRPGQFPFKPELISMRATALIRRQIAVIIFIGIHSGLMLARTITFVIQPAIAKRLQRTMKRSEIQTTERVLMIGEVKIPGCFT